MEFHVIRKKDLGLLTPSELKILEDLISKGVTIINELNNECTFEKINKLITNYAKLVNSKNNMLENIIERTLTVNPELGVHVNEIISNTNELINALKSARVINRYHESIFKRLEEFLAKKKVFVKIKPTINYWLNNSNTSKTKLVLSLKELKISSLVTDVIRLYLNEINENLLFTDEDKIEAGILKDFIEGLNEEELKLAINEDSSHADFLMQSYILLNTQLKSIRHITTLLNDFSNINSESELNAKIAMVNFQLKKISSDLTQSLDIINKARQKGVVTQRLISPYNEREMLSNSSEILKSYLRLRFEPKNLIENLTFEFLTIYKSLPQELSDYNDYTKRANYEFLKTFFS